MNQLATLADRIDGFHLSPAMVAASEAHQMLQAAARAFQAARDLAASELAGMRGELQAVQDAAGAADMRSLELAIADVESARGAIAGDQAGSAGDDVLSLLSSAADALRDLA